MKDFDYYEPTTLEEAIKLLRQKRGTASVIAGGTDLLVQIKEHVRKPDHVINIKLIPGMDDLSYDDHIGLCIGALTTTRSVETSSIVRKHYPNLARATTDFASVQVRNRATVIGNVCRASPSADTLPPLIADKATVQIHGPRGVRMMQLENFVIGPGKTALEADEIVTHIHIPPPAPNTGKAYIKHGRRIAMELATVGVAVSLTMEDGICKDARIVLGAVGPTPIRSRLAEDIVRSTRVTADTIASAAQAAKSEARPISDVRGSDAYRRQMVAVLTRRALEQALKEAQ
jgi:carbon-monoxide dehydrogenase medium subunit